MTMELGDLSLQDASAWEKFKNRKVAKTKYL
jgi:hypothetical protein